MEHQDTLLTLAEIAATFVGFSTVATALSPGRMGARKIQLREVAEISLSAGAVCLAPIAMTGAFDDSVTMWRLVSGVFAAVWLVAWVLAIRRARAVGIPAFFGAFVLPLDVSFNLLGQLLLWWNVLAPGPQSATRYVVSVAALLGAASLSFIAAIFGEEPETDEA